VVRACPTAKVQAAPHPKLNKNNLVSSLIFKTFEIQYLLCTTQCKSCCSVTIICVIDTNKKLQKLFTIYYFICKNNQIQSFSHHSMRGSNFDMNRKLYGQRMQGLYFMVLAHATTLACEHGAVSCEREALSVEPLKNDIYEVFLI